MILSVILDNDGYITQFCTGGYLENETTHFEIEEIPDDFYTLFGAYRVEKDMLILDTKIVASVEEKNELQELRNRREIECFSYINRGQLWYDRLTKEQLSELNEWYEAWLNVTEKVRGAKSFSVPEKPRWLE